MQTKSTLIRAIGVAAILICLSVAPLRAQSGLIPLYSAAGTTFDGSVNFAALGANKAVIASGTAVAISGLPCLTVTFSTATGLSLQRLDQGMSGWGGNFAPGTPLLWTSGSYQGAQGTLWKGNGPLTLTFNTAQTQTCGNTSGEGEDNEHDWDDGPDGQDGTGSNAANGSAVIGVGFQIQSDVWGPFTATLCAYDSANNLLFCNSFPGMSNFNSDNSAIFTGLLAPLAGSHIAKIAISTNDNDFAISGPLVKSTGSNLSSGPAGWWLFNESSGITAKDSSGNHDDGMLQGAAFFANDPQRGNVLSINGVSGEVDIPFSQNLEPAVGTVSVWVKPNRAQDGNIIRQATDMLLRSNRSGAFDAYSLSITDEGRAIAAVANDNPNASSPNPRIVLASSEHTVDLNEWTQLVMSWDGSNLSLYANGEKIGSTPYNPNPATGLSYHGTAPLKVAASSCDGTDDRREYGGELSDLRIYSRPLTDSEIQQLYAGH